MASNDRGSGPIVGQMVRYNNAGTVTAAVIYGINTNGTVNLNYFGSGGVTNVNSVGFDANEGTGKWNYAPFH